MTTQERTTQEAILSEYDFIFLGDKSGSMARPEKSGDAQGRTRWTAMQESAETFARDISKIDSDGFGFGLFGGADYSVKDGCSVDDVVAGFASNQPRGGTPMAQALTSALALAGKSAKKDFIVVYTDGVPDDKNAVAKVIRDQANKQTADDECTILFVQVGDDPEATAYLKALDDNLKGAKFDIVDAVTVAEADKFPSTAALIIKAISD